jgi:glycosyltransferase involved in cell wall biosynthesis
MSIRTLHLTNCWHTESGGIATFYRELLRGAERHCRPVRLVIPGDRDDMEECGAYTRIYHVTGRPVRFSGGYRLVMPRNYLLPNSSLRRILADESPDLVECCDRYTLNYMAAMLRRRWLLGRDFRPTVVGLHCDRMDDNVAAYVSRSRLWKSFCRWYLRWLDFPMFDHHIAVSEYVAGELKEVAGGHDVRRGVWVRPMGVSSGVFRPDKRNSGLRKWVRSLSAAPEDSTLLLYAGRLALEKNLQLLIDMMALLEESAPGAFHLVVAGEGPQRASLEHECRRRIPGAACFLGHVANREILSDIYANCDIFVHPNSREPFGIAPLEAMAAGLALVVPPTGGITHYVDSTNAWVVNADPQSFSAAVQAIREDPERAELLRRNARATAEKFDWDRVIDGYFELYDELHELVQNPRKKPRLAPAFFSTSGNQIRAGGLDADAEPTNNAA